jgi:uncharacterized membrane protein YgcG
MKTLAIGFGLVLVAASASAQSATDSRWTPWLGCWDLVIENARDGSPAADLPRPQRGSSPRGDLRPRVCVERADAGATFRTTIGDRTPIVQTIVADGTARPITDTDCTGTQSAEWSRDGLRMFSRAELTCKGDAGSRRVSGLGILGANGTWIDVQSIVIDGRDTYRVRRYRRQDPAAPSDARQPGRALTLDDVKEASAKVTPHALEAALVETNASFALSSQRLIELDEARVPEQVIDLMVALSYPKRFVVERTARVDVGPAPLGIDPLGLGWFGYPLWSDGFGLYSPFYGPYSSYYYSPFAYHYLGYNPYFNYGGGFAILDPGVGGGVGPNRPSGSGRVVDGLGYTRVRPRETEPAPGTSGVGTASAGSGSSSGSSSGGSTVSSQGFSQGGGGSSDGGRTAQPR